VARGPAGRQWPALLLAVLTLATLVLMVVLDVGIRSAGEGGLAILVPINYPPVFAALSSALVGLVVAVRRPGHPGGWLLLATGASLGLAGAGMASVNAAVAGVLVPGAARLSPYLPVCILTTVITTGLLVAVTPAGVLPSPRWRPVAAVLAALPLLAALAVALDPAPGLPGPVSSPLELDAMGGGARLVFQVAFGIGQAANVVAVVALVLRLRRARGVERLQLRWLALGLGIVVALSVVVVTGVLAGAGELAGIVGGLCPAIVAGATGAAVLRYRLYDLDRLISRTVSYGLVTVVLGGGYALVVLGVGHWLASRSSILVAGATLALAAVFRPLLRRIQRVVDRRFDRRRYDAARTIDAFAAGLRRHVDLDTLAAELRGVVDDTMSPVTSGLWLRPRAAGPQPAGSTSGSAATADARV
jgi:hypothetical protein